MSQVLVSPPPMPPLATTPLMEAASMDRTSAQLHLSATGLAGDREQGAASLQEKRTASQLAHLASQHHTSEYNKLKFGPRGSPAMYIPLSIQMPAQVRELKERQEQNAKRKVWWPADAPTEMSWTSEQAMDQDFSEEPPQQENIAPYGRAVCSPEPELGGSHLNLNKPVPPLNHPHTLNLQRELSVAMSSPLSVISISSQLSTQGTFQQRNLNMYAKTSESHPINISTIIPFELLPLISSHLSPTPPHAPYMFDLPPSLFLDHVTAHSPLPHSDHIRPYQMIRNPNGSVSHLTNGTGSPACGPSCLGLWSNPVSDEIRAMSITNGSTFVPHNYEQKPNNSLHGPANDSETTRPPDNPPLAEKNCPVDSFPSHASLYSSSTYNRPQSAPPLLLSSLTAPPEVLANEMTTMSPSLPELVHAMSSDILSSEGAAVNTEKPAAPFPYASNISPSITWALNLPPNFIPHSRPLLGNLLLSSCPGKKVRLSGPVKGRGAICRDLGHDLRRVKAMGVGCIICCLDDEELEFLGASWPEYSEIARAVGIDVLRIPTPEGLAPTTPALLDQHLSNLIQSYTLKGTPILVHCRGGVGRAGLVACCWMLKLGLCGWLSPPLEDTNGHELDGSSVKVRRETAELVERVIAVVRRRRSVKAIETYEQVRFLVDFVEQLEAGGHRIPL